MGSSLARARPGAVSRSSSVSCCSAGRAAVAAATAGRPVAALRFSSSAVDAGAAAAAAVAAAAAAATSSHAPRIHRSQAEPFDGMIVGGGIVGLACARALALRNPRRRIGLVEAGEQLAQAQSSHNSGVVHAGIYYKPGSARAQLCRRGAEDMLAYCASRGIAARKVGKLIVALDESERAGLQTLLERGKENGVKDLELLSGARLRELEPRVAGVEGILSPHTAVTHFGWVAHSYAKEFTAAGGQIHTGFAVEAVSQERPIGASAEVITLRARSGQTLSARKLLFAGGMYADRLAALCGGQVEPRIVPVRGSWLQLKREHVHIVHRNIYPVPNAAFPFLGVHFTPEIAADGSVSGMLLGPNAVLATSREGYAISDFSLCDTLELAGNASLRNMTRKHWRFGLNQALGELLPSRALRDCQRYVPSLRWEHLQLQQGWLQRPLLKSGVRSQAMGPNGSLIEDFVIQEQLRVGDPAAPASSAESAAIMHIRNAPSPAATSSLAIAELVAERAEKAFHW